MNLSLMETRKCQLKLREEPDVQVAIKIFFKKLIYPEDIGIVL